MNAHLARPYDYSKNPVSVPTCPIQQRDHTSYPERFRKRLAPITSMRHLYNPVPKNHPHNIVEEYPARYDIVPVHDMYSKDTSLFDEAGKRLSYQRMTYPLHDMNVQNRALYKRDNDGDIKRLKPRFTHHVHNSLEVQRRFPEHYNQDVRTIYSEPDSRERVEYGNTADIDSRTEIIPIRHATVPKPKHGKDIYAMI